MLAVATDPAWVARVLAEPDTLLLDVAHCEKKAAGTALSFLFRAPESGLVDLFSRLAREELVHFEWCLQLMKARGQQFTRLEPSRYAGELARHARKGNGPEALMDALLCMALIEARSGERLALLRDASEDPGLTDLFARLYPPEERHHVMLLEAAERFGDPTKPLQRLAAIEAELIRQGEPVVRMHS